MQQRLPAATPHRTLPDVWELARRFSGIVAIGVLGFAMIALAFRSSVPPTSAAASRAPVTTLEASRAAASVSASAQQPAPSGRLGAMVVYYLVSTDAQLEAVYKIEAEAWTEAEEQGSDVDDYRFFVLQMDTPEAEQRAKDEIFAAMRASPSTRIVVQDVR